MSSIESLRSITTDIQAGFESLLQRLEAQKQIEAELRRQLEKAIERVSHWISHSYHDIRMLYSLALELIKC